jgi:PAS domain-containing protein
MGKLWVDPDRMSGAFLGNRVHAHLYDNAPELGLAVGLWSWDCATGAVDWSPENHRLHGLPEHITPDWDEWAGSILEEDRDAAISAVRRAMAGRQTIHLAYQTRDHFLIGRGALVLDESGEIARIIGCNIDATRLWQTLNVLRTSAESLAIGLGADKADPDTGQSLIRQIRDGLTQILHGIFVPPNK